MKVAVCIPTYNEADCIASSTAAVDDGLQELHTVDEVTIVNADNGSEDGTSQIFLNTRTKSLKAHIRSEQVGKGSNLFSFWKFCLENEIECGATIDADVKSIGLDWPQKMFQPILEGSAEYVTPIYERSRFEGSTTNHFAYPIIFGLLGGNVRQPIGGEFAFSGSLMSYWLGKPRAASDMKYGIDIFMTIHALEGGFECAAQTLGKKLHKPSFPKIKAMFREVADSAFQALLSHGTKHHPGATSAIFRGLPQTNILENTAFGHKAEAASLVNDAVTELGAVGVDRTIFSGPAREAILARVVDGKPLDEQSWPHILHDAVINAGLFRGDAYLQFLSVFTNLFILRSVDFWMAVETATPIETEERIWLQANNFSDLLFKV